MRLFACLISIFALLITPIHANTEKVIFRAPRSAKLPNSLLALSEHRSIVLSPEQSSIRTSLPVAFPTTENTRGLEYWYLLRRLNERQRYEVRVCWAAIQPTEFWLDVFTVDELDTLPRALESLSRLSRGFDGLHPPPKSSLIESILVLRLQAAADCYSSNKSLMLRPPPVDIDIILDPYLWSVFPTSLLPIAAYITILAGLGWYISDIIWSYLASIADSAKHHTE